MDDFKLNSSTRKNINLKKIFPKIPRGAYLTHGFDTYPAKMIPHMAKFLINKISKPGQTILDPFCGSGSVLIESSVSGRNSIGVDLNPLAILYTKAKTNIYDTVKLESQLEEIIRKFSRYRNHHKYNFPNANYWFTPATLRKLGVIKKVLDNYLGRIEPDYIHFWRAVKVAIVRECSKADTRGPKPFISKKARKERVGKHFDPFKFFESKARSCIMAQNRYKEKIKESNSKPKTKVIEGDSRNLMHLLSSEKIDAVLTSPPYLNAQDYYRSSKLQLFTLGCLTETDLRHLSKELVGSDRIRIEQELIDTNLPCSLSETIKLNLLKRNKKSACVFSKYVLDMSKVLGEISYLLKSGSYCAIVSGHNLISGIEIPTPEVIIQLASKQGLQLSVCYIDKIRDRWVPTIRNGHNGVIDDEHLLVFRKIESKKVSGDPPEAVLP